MAKKREKKVTPAPSKEAEDAGLLPLPKGTMIDGIDCSGMTDDPKKAGTPVYLQKQNEKPPPPEVKAEIEAKIKKAQSEAYDSKEWGKPKGMSHEDWEAWKSRDRQANEAKKAERFESLRERKRVNRVSKSPPSDTFRLLDWARDNDLDPRLVRRAARANKGKLKPLESLKYIYPNKIKDQVASIIRAGLSGKVKSPKAKAVK